jgi:hypothetical protein
VPQESAIYSWPYTYMEELTAILQLHGPTGKIAAAIYLAYIMPNMSTQPYWSSQKTGTCERERMRTLASAGVLSTFVVQTLETYYISLEKTSLTI